MPIRPSYQWRGGQSELSGPLNTGTSDPINDLSGDNGVIQYRDSLAVLSGSGGDRTLNFPAGTTAQRPPNPEPGYARFNTTIPQLEFWDGFIWRRWIG